MKSSTMQCDTTSYQSKNQYAVAIAICKSWLLIVEKRLEVEKRLISRVV